MAEAPKAKLIRLGNQAARVYNQQKRVYQDKLVKTLSLKLSSIKPLFNPSFIGRIFKSTHGKSIRKIADLSLAIKQTKSLSYKQRLRSQQIKEMGLLFQKIKDETPIDEKKNLNIHDFFDNFNSAITEADPDYKIEDLADLTNQADINALDNLILINEAKSANIQEDLAPDPEEDYAPPPNPETKPQQPFPPFPLVGGSGALQQLPKAVNNATLLGTEEEEDNSEQLSNPIGRLHPQAPEEFNGGNFTKQATKAEDLVQVYKAENDLTFPDIDSKPMKASLTQAHINTDKDGNPLDLTRPTKKSINIFKGSEGVGTYLRLRVFRTEDQTLTKSSILEGENAERLPTTLVKNLPGDLILRDGQIEGEQKNSIAATVGTGSPKPAIFTLEKGDEKSRIAIIANPDKEKTKLSEYAADKYETYVVTFAAAKKELNPDQGLVIFQTDSDLLEIALQILAAIETDVKINQNQLKKLFPGKEDAIDELIQEVQNMYSSASDPIDLNTLFAELILKIEALEAKHFQKPDIIDIPEPLSLTKTRDEQEWGERTIEEYVDTGLFYERTDNEEEVDDLFNGNLFEDTKSGGRIPKANKIKEVLAKIRDLKLREKDPKATIKAYIEAFEAFNIPHDQIPDDKILLSPSSDPEHSLNLGGQALIAFKAGFTPHDIDDFEPITSPINWKAPKAGDVLKMKGLLTQTPVVEEE